MHEINEALINELDGVAAPQDLIAAIVSRFGDRAAIGTSGQLTGMVMIDMAMRAKTRPRIFTIDTLRLFNETYAYFDAIEEKYGIEIERMQPDPAKLNKMLAQHGEYLFFDSPEKQEFCCQIRKVEPNNRALDSVDVWLSGLRRDQSVFRSDMKRLEIIEHGPERRPILKVCPLIDWSEAQCRAYLQENQVPIHPLLEWENEGWRYESLGCRICSTAIGPNEPRRAGRWRWFNSGEENKECGLHTSHHDPDTKDEA